MEQGLQRVRDLRWRAITGLSKSEGVLSSAHFVRSFIGARSFFMPRDRTAAATGCKFENNLNLLTGHLVVSMISSMFDPYSRFSKMTEIGRWVALKPMRRRPCRQCFPLRDM